MTTVRSGAVLLAAGLVLAGCSASPSSAPATSKGATPTTSDPVSSASARILATPIVSALPYHLLVGVGRSATIDAPCSVLPSCNGAIIAGGLVAGDTTTDAVQLVDFGSGKVTRLSSLSVPVHDTAGGVDLAKAPIVIGGGNTSEQSVVQAYGATGWRVISHLPATRSDLSAVQSINGIPLILGGYDGATPAVGAVLGGDGDTWTGVGTLAVPLRYMAAAAAPDKTVWLFGGEVSGAESDTVQTFDPGTKKGKVVAHLPRPLGHMSAIAVGNKFLVMGGRTDASSGAMTDQMWWFDPATLTFSGAGRLPYPVADAMIARGSGNGPIYLIGGESPHPITSILQIKVTL